MAFWFVHLVSVHKRSVHIWPLLFALSGPSKWIHHLQFSPSSSILILHHRITFLLTFFLIWYFGCVFFSWKLIQELLLHPCVCLAPTENMVKWKINYTLIVKTPTSAVKAKWFPGLREKERERERERESTGGHPAKLRQPRSCRPHCPNHATPLDRKSVV